jgi:hypothetical protein
MFRKRKDPFPMELEGIYLRYMAFVIEGAIKNMKQGAEQWVWVLDLAGEGRGLGGNGGGGEGLPLLARQCSHADCPAATVGAAAAAVYSSANAPHLSTTLGVLSVSERIVSCWLLRAARQPVLT